MKHWSVDITALEKDPDAYAMAAYGLTDFDSADKAAAEMIAKSIAPAVTIQPFPVESKT